MMIMCNKLCLQFTHYSRVKFADGILPTMDSYFFVFDKSSVRFASTVCIAC